MKTMESILRPVLFVLAALWLSSCGEVEPAQVGEARMPTIYGERDQHEFYESTIEAAAALFDAEVMLISEGPDFLVPSGDGYAITYTKTLSQYLQSRYGYPLCADEPYGDQPVPGFCSGFMVGDDLIATAGHCISKVRDCQTTSFIFNYHVPGADGAPAWVPADDVYECAEIVGSVNKWSNDYAVIRVDRPIVGHTAIPLRRTGAVESDDAVAGLAVIGHPVGLPAKLADNSWITDASHPYYFQSNLDVYGGNSGSAVVSLTNAGDLYLTEGILVRGNYDWMAVVKDGVPCMASVFCDDTGCTGTAGSGWEECTRATQFASLVPQPPVCGNAVCEAGEDCSTCQDDCGACPYCGDGACNGDENCDTCQIDCGYCPECFSAGQACTSNDDCCSGRCHPKQLVCK